MADLFSRPYLGKTSQEALSLVNAWASNNELVLAQYKTNGKGA